MAIDVKNKITATVEDTANISASVEATPVINLSTSNPIYRGPKGDKGERGEMGPAGPQGPKGEDGFVKFEELTDEQKELLRGPQGIQGPQGPKGDKGDKGDQGSVGPQGPQGEPGPKGEDGFIKFEELTAEQKEQLRGPQGIQGERGPQGETGPIGPAGPQGIQGEQGIPGEKGEDGAIGPQGPAGANGPQGEAGPRGEQGPQGPIGPQGEIGPAGPAGKDGADGAQGPQGEKGEPGSSGVYVGTDTPTSEVNVWIDPSGDAYEPENGGNSGRPIIIVPNTLSDNNIGEPSPLQKQKEFKAQLKEAFANGLDNYDFILDGSDSIKINVRHSKTSYTNKIFFVYIASIGGYMIYEGYINVADLDTVEDRTFFTGNTVITSGNVQSYISSGGSWVYVSVDNSQAYIDAYTTHIKLLYTYDMYDGIIDMSLPYDEKYFYTSYNDFVGGCVWNYSSYDMIPIRVRNQSGYITLVDARDDTDFGAYIKGYYYWQEG